MKIAIVGPESSGKTHLASALNEHYKGTLIGDYSRTYLELNGLEYAATHIECMAREHASLIKSKTTAGLCFLDTDILNYYIWLEVKFRVQSCEIYSMWLDCLPDLYLLVQPDLPWEFDVMRESENSRHILFNMHYNFISKSSCPYSIMSGFGRQSFNKALFIINSYIHLHFR